MPVWLEVGLSCEKFHCTPDVFGFDAADPRVARTLRTSLNIYHVATEREQAKDKREWEKNHPQGSRLLHYARNGPTDHPAPMEVRIEIPQRPK